MNDSVLRAILATPDHRCDCRAIRWSDADDVRQQAALEALTLGDEVEKPESLARFRVKRAAIGIARHEMAACRGRALLVNESDSASGVIEAPSEHETPVAEAIRNEDDAEISAAIASLTEAQQQVIRLRFWGGLTCAAIGDELGLSESAVGGLLKRALRALRCRYAA